MGATEPDRGQQTVRLSQCFGVKGTVAFLAADATVIEFFSDSEIKTLDIEGIKACFK